MTGKCSLDRKILIGVQEFLYCTENDSTRIDVTVLRGRFGLLSLRIGINDRAILQLFPRVTSMCRLTAAIRSGKDLQNWRQPIFPSGRLSVTSGFLFCCSLIFHARIMFSS